MSLCRPRPQFFLDPPLTLVELVQHAVGVRRKGRRPVAHVDRVACWGRAGAGDRCVAARAVRNQEGASGPYCAWSAGSACAGSPCRARQVQARGAREKPETKSEKENEIESEVPRQSASSRFGLEPSWFESHTNLFPSIVINFFFFLFRIER